MKAISQLAAILALFLSTSTQAMDVRALSLVGTLTDAGVEFEASGTIVLENRRGGDVSLLAGNIALLESPVLKYGEIKYNDGEYRLLANRSGEYPFSIRFLAKVSKTDDLSEVTFKFLSTPIRRLELKGFPENSDVQVANAATPIRKDNTWIAPLSPNSLIHFSWMPAVPENEGQLFYTANTTNIAAVAPGMIKQNQQTELQILQGELSKVAFLIKGPGEISEVEGLNLLGWKVENRGDSQRQLVVQFNRPQTGVILLLVRSQTTLPKLPATSSPLLLQPLKSTRSSGNLLLLSDGAVNLGIASLQNLSQVSPAQIPLSKNERSTLKIDNRQAFGFRYAGTGQNLQLQIENILPEISVSSITLHYLGLNESTLTADINLEIREASLQELDLHLPLDYSIVNIEHSLLSDYTSTSNQEVQSLQLIFKSPIIGRQSLKLELERNRETRDGALEIPSVSIPTAKSVRGYVGVSSESGIKATRLIDNGLTEIIPSYFPVKGDQLQVAYRIRDPEWTASVNVEHLEPTIQADSLHLFSLAENAVYGSSILTYQISGAPIQALSLDMAPSYENVELHGANIRDWREENGKYFISFHSPVSGTYSLLATYESKQGADLTPLSFNGAIPLETHSERGYIVFVSPTQVELGLGKVQSPLLTLEAKELPPEYQIMIDSPIIASLHYTSRPFELAPKLNALSREQSIDQVVEFAEINTNVTKTGEILFEANYLLKSKNVANFYLQLPQKAQLWKVSVDGNEPVISRNEKSILVPIGNSLSSATRSLSIRYALQSDPESPTALQTPILAAPTLQTHWKLSPDKGYKLSFIGGSVDPVSYTPEPTPLQGFLQTSYQRRYNDSTGLLVFAIVCATPFLLLLRRTKLIRKLRWLPYLGALAAAFGLLISIPFSASFEIQPLPRSSNELVVQDTVLSPGEALELTILNEETAPVPASQTVVPWLFLIIALPILYSFAVKRLASKHLQIPATLGINIATASILAFTSEGAALTIAFLAGLYFGPVLYQSLSAIVSNYQTHPNRNNISTAGAAIAIAILVSLTPTDTQAQDRTFVPNDGLQYTSNEPVQLSAQVTEEQATVTLNMTWDAESNETTPVLFFPAVITRLELPKYVTLGQRQEGENSAYTLTASRSGKHEIEIEYQTLVTNSNGVWAFSIQSIPSLVYKSKITFNRKDCEIESASAIGLTYQPVNDPEQTTVELHFQPDWNISIVAKPKNRDTRLEETVFYAETVNSYRPQAGAIEGLHDSTLRIAQGELRTVEISIPADATVTDVEADWVETWRFDPARKTLSIASKRPLKGSETVSFSTQTNAKALPYSAKLTLIRFKEAESELGWLGLSVTKEEQLETVTASEGLASVSTYDFPAMLADPRSEEFKLRRAYRYADTSSTINFDLSRVDPEIRVESEELTSLSEDRIVHNATLKTQIIRSGVFSIQLHIPNEYDIEKISGPEVSHWTETSNTKNRLVTLHFKSRTEGETTQHITLSASGIRESASWSPPHIKVLNASKHRGTLTLSPELGLQLKLLERSGISQLDPQEVNSIDRNRIGFRLLENNWHLGLSIHPVDPWIDCLLLQEITFKAGVVETKAKLRYEIKNAGVKQLRVKLPDSAIGVHFIGQHVSAYQQVPDSAGLWEIDIDRRLVNSYTLEVEYQEFGDSQESTYSVTGIVAEGVQLQESYLSLGAKQRLSLHLEQTPEHLNAIEWQQVPDPLRLTRFQNAATAVYRTTQPSFTLPLSIDRLDMASVLPAEIRSVKLDSILSESGMILTRAVFKLDSGHKPNLSFSLPERSQFWSCYLAEQSVWPVEKEGKLTVPLPVSGSDNALIDLEIYYLQPQPETPSEQTFLGPQCDLPLENIEWRIFVPTDYKSLEWTGSLDPVPSTQYHDSSFGLDSLRKRNQSLESKKLKDAESLLKLGNTLAKQGKQLDAKRALESAYNLSLNDLDFNEDARVQWNNLRIQQAMVGLTTRRSNAFNKTATLDLNQDESEHIHFSSTWADQLLQDNNSAEENRALSDLALRFVEHQDSALRSPSGLSTVFPEHGLSYSFTRKLQSEPWQEMKLELKISDTESKAMTPIVLIVLAAGLLSLLQLSKRSRI